MRQITSVILTTVVNEWLFHNDRLLFSFQELEEAWESIYLQEDLPNPYLHLNNSEFNNHILAKFSEEDDSQVYIGTFKETLNKMKSFLSWFVTCKVLGVKNGRISFTPTEREALRGSNTNFHIGYKWFASSTNTVYGDCRPGDQFYNHCTYDADDFSNSSYSNSSACDSDNEEIMRHEHAKRNPTDQYLFLLKTRVRCIKDELELILKFLQALHKFLPIRYHLLNSDQHIDNEALFQKQNMLLLCPCNPKMQSWVRAVHCDTCFETVQDGVYGNANGV